MKKTRLLYLAVTLCFVLCLNACNDDDAPPSTDLQITFTDESGNLLSDVSVSLYSSLQDWEASTNAIVTSLTSEEGVVLFTDLEIKDYFIDATKGDLSNWSTDIQTGVIMENMRTRMSLELNANLTNFLVGKKEKSYQWTDLRIDGFSLFGEVDECEKDNMLFFQRQDQLGLESFGDLPCDEGEPDQALFSWRFSDDQSKLIIEDESQESITYKVISISDTKLTFEIDIELEGQLVTTEVDFSAL